MSNISLNSGIRSSLLALQQTDRQFQTTSNRLATGQKVNSAIDNPTNFFAALNLTDRASGLNARLDSMGTAVQQIKAADTGIGTIRSLLSSMEGLVNSALSEGDSDQREALGRQFNELIAQINSTAKDSDYAGVNLVQGNETNTVQFHENFNESTLDVKGFNVEGAEEVDASGNMETVASDAVIVNSNGGTETGNAALVIGSQDGDTLGVQAAGADGIDWSDDDTYQDTLVAVVQQIGAFEDELRTQASAMANNLSTISIREDFTNEMINTLQEGADDLTLADLNEEGANLLALQTASSLATQSLSLGAQQSQQVLQLLG